MAAHMRNISNYRRDELKSYSICAGTIIEATDCTLPSNETISEQLRNEIKSGGAEGRTTIRGGPYYTCQVQGTTMGTYQELSVIMEYTIVSGDRVGQFEMTCQASPDGWGRRSDSLTVLSSGPGVTYDGSIGFRTDCSSCINTAGNPQHCVACHSSCNDGLMRCTGSASDDCCVAFEDDGVCKTDLNCITNNFIANTQNSFTCACGLSSCSDGYTVNSTSCTCTLTDICVADNPCNINGVCILHTAPDQYTCNCTSTGYTGTNCTVCPECPVGYSMITSNCSCYQSHICLIDNPCDNGGNCTIQDGDNNYTCINDYNGTNCTDCILECPDGYIIDDDCYVCLLDDICVADNPCINNGSCVSGPTPEEYTCNCTDSEFTGTNCSVYDSSASNDESFTVISPQQTSPPSNNNNNGSPNSRDDLTAGITIGSLVSAILVSLMLLVGVPVMFTIMKVRRNEWTLCRSSNRVTTMLGGDHEPVAVVTADDHVLPLSDDVCTTLIDEQDESTQNDNDNNNDGDVDKPPGLYTEVNEPLSKPVDLKDGSVMANQEPYLYSVVRKPPSTKCQLVNDATPMVEEKELYSCLKKPLEKDGPPTGTKDDQLPVEIIPHPTPKNTSMEPDHEAYDVLRRDTQPPYMIHPQQQYEDGVTYDILLRERTVTTDYTNITMNDQKDNSI